MAKKHLSSVSNSYENAHEVKKGDPRVDGPYLDDIRDAQQEEYREKRTNALNAAAEKRAAEKEAEIESEEALHSTEGQVITEPNANVDADGNLINDPFAAFESNESNSDQKESKDDDDKS